MRAHIVRAWRAKVFARSNSGLQGINFQDSVDDVDGQRSHIWSHFQTLKLCSSESRLYILTGVPCLRGQRYNICACMK